jgi:hypothetical protein
VPKCKCTLREHTEDWQTIQHSAFWPEQTAYALLRPLVLFGDPAGKRAQETGAAEGNLDHMTDLFDDQGLSSLFASRPHTHLKKQHEALRPICASSLWISACRTPHDLFARNRRDLCSSFSSATFPSHSTACACLWPSTLDQDQPHAALQQNT